MNKGHFKLVLCGVDGEHSSLALSVQTEHITALHSCDVDGQVQGTNDAVIPVCVRVCVCVRVRV